MGRLTLNIHGVLRSLKGEASGERIRDGPASSKMKGMELGGPPPLGYDVC